MNYFGNFSRNIYPAPNGTDLLSIEEISKLELEKEVKGRRDFEINIVRTIDERVFALTLEIAKEK